MSARMIMCLALLGALSVDCAKRLPPPCIGAACRTWPHVALNFWRGQGPPSGRRYTGALCVQVSFDCPEEGRHEVWIEPEAGRCPTYLRTEGPEWLKVENGRLSIPWPARCRGDRVEMYVTAQPNFALCDAVNNQLITANRVGLTADLTFQCR
jgi:hypothetical protein